MGYFSNAALFLVETFFGLYIFAVLLRFLLQRVRADFHNPIAQFLVAITNPPLKPLRRVVPGLFGIDLASVLLLLILEAIRAALIYFLAGQAFNPTAIVLSSVVDLLRATINLFLFAILIRVILSWVNPYPNAATQLLARLTDPLLRPAQRVIPPFSGVDLSPVLVMIGLVLVQMLIVSPLADFGSALAGIRLV